MGSDIDELNPGEARNQSTAPLPRQLCDELRYRLAQVVNGYTGRCDEDAARAGDRVDARAISGSRADAAVLAMADHPRTLEEILADMDPAERARLERRRSGDGELMPDINDSKPWSEMDIADLTSHILYGADLEQTATFLCRAGTPDDVARKAAELGLKWQRRASKGSIDDGR